MTRSLSIRREVETANNFLDTYLGWRGSLVSLQELKHYDFEFDPPVIQHYGIQANGIAAPN